jgi:hypothetical protein
MSWTLTLTVGRSAIAKADAYHKANLQKVSPALIRVPQCFRVGCNDRTSTTAAAAFRRIDSVCCFDAVDRIALRWLGPMQLSQAVHTPLLCIQSADDVFSSAADIGALSELLLQVSSVRAVSPAR